MFLLDNFKFIYLNLRKYLDFVSSHGVYIYTDLLYF